jgi:hypothetical protein
MKKALFLLLCAGAALALAACGARQEPVSGMQIANPFVEYGSLEEAARAAGFELAVPEAPEGYDETIIQVMDDSMIQVIYRSGDDRLLIRKAAGDEDISGDYNQYTESSTVSVNGADVTLRGDGGKISVATWVRDGYTYAVDLDRPMAPEELTALIGQIS